MQKLTAFKALVTSKNPTLGAKMTGFSWFRNTSIQAEFASDPEIKAEWDKLSAIMAESRRNRESSGGRSGGSSRGSTGSSSGRRGGNH